QPLTAQLLFEPALPDQEVGPLGVPLGDVLRGELRAREYLFVLDRNVEPAQPLEDGLDRVRRVVGQDEEPLPLARPYLVDDLGPPELDRLLLPGGQDPVEVEKEELLPREVDQCFLAARDVDADISFPERKALQTRRLQETPYSKSIKAIGSEPARRFS